MTDRLSSSSIPDPTLSGKIRSVILIALAQVAALSVWFSSSAIIPDITQEFSPSPGRLAALTSAVQLGFVAGAFASAVLSLPDRMRPQSLFALSALSAALANAYMLVTIPGGDASIAARFVVGAALAGVYPVGLKLAAGWGRRDRGLLVGLLVGALTLGSAFPHLLAGSGLIDWRNLIGATSLVAALSAALILFTRTGPFHGSASGFDPHRAMLIWRDPVMRRINLGYLGHMWELYAMWAWIGFALIAEGGFTQNAASQTTFAVIAIGAPACALGGYLADRLGKARFTILAMATSGVCALLSGALLHGPVWLLLPVLLIWGASVIADSAQFSALIVDHAPQSVSGSMLTMQTLQGFLLTVVTVQGLAWLSAAIGWQTGLAILALGPALGIAAMWRLRER